VVVLDPGHGGDDAGANGKKGKEKDVVLNITLKLGAKINTRLPDVKVIYTRQTDTFIDVAERGVIANKAGADLFISIHANATISTSIYGTETYVMGLDKASNNEVALMENAAIAYEENYETKYEGYDPNSPESFIVLSFMQNAYLEQGLTLSSYIETEFADRIKRKSRGVKQGPFLVLWKPAMPSILTEVGFMSNPEEERYLLSNEGQEELAEALFFAINEYKKRLEKGELVPKQVPANNASKGGMQWRGVNSPNPSPTTTAAAKPQQPATKPQATNTAKPQTTPTTTNKPSSSGKVTYHIQILSSRKPLPDNAKEFKGLKNVRSYRSGDDYRYYVETGNSLDELTKPLREIRKKFPDAFVVKLQNNQPYK
jgi:N-acetylmuramoyl-L-alanine amidase